VTEYRSNAKVAGAAPNRAVWGSIPHGPVKSTVRVLALHAGRSLDAPIPRRMVPQRGCHRKIGAKERLGTGEPRWP